MNLVPGTLWCDLLATEHHALASGALKSVPTRYEIIEDGGVRFSVRVLAALSRKDEARKEQETGSRAGKPANPFLPPERNLVVASVTDSHLAILNKFNVVPRHLLIVTKEFEEQETLLTLQDFEALRLCMTEYEGLGFYNGGEAGGASQRHKHLQLVPLPLDSGGMSVPIQPLIANLPADVITRIPGFSFSHAFVRLRPSLIDTGDAADVLFDSYVSLLKAVGMSIPSRERGTRQSGPYCFLITRDWMFLVPRSREHFEDISFNSLAFAGSLFVRNDRQLDRLRAVGPMFALKQITR